jgi:hypothetical protein
MRDLPFDPLHGTPVFFKSVEGTSQPAHPASQGGTLLFQPDTQAGELTLASIV